MESAPTCDDYSKSEQNHYLVFTKYACFYDFVLAQTPSKNHPKRYPKRVPKLNIPGHQKSIFGEFLVTPSFREVWGVKSQKNEAPK